MCFVFIVISARKRRIPRKTLSRALLNSRQVSGGDGRCVREVKDKTPVIFLLNKCLDMEVQQKENIQVDECLFSNVWDRETLPAATDEIEH